MRNKPEREGDPNFGTKRSLVTDQEQIPNQVGVEKKALTFAETSGFGVFQKCSSGKLSRHIHISHRWEAVG